MRPAPSSGTSAGKPSSAARGARPTSSAPVTGTRARTAAVSSARLTRSGALDVHRDLEALAELQAERAHARQLLAQRRGGRAGLVERRRIGEPQVERDQRRAGSDEGGTGGRVQARRAEIGAQLSRGHAPRELLRPASAQLGSGASAGQLAVEEDRQVERAPELVRGDQRLGAGRALVGGVDPDDRRDVERPHERVRARVIADVHARDDLARAVHERGRQRARRAGQRDRRAVVLGVGVEVEQARRRPRIFECIARAPGRARPTRWEMPAGSRCLE